MDVNAALAAQNYTATKPATAADPGATMGRAATDFLATLQRGEETAQAAMKGEAGPHMLVQALTETRSAVETVVAVRDKVVEAYQEILRMPV